MFGRKWKNICIFAPIMVIFIGEYPSKLDDKGRLVMPSALKKAVPEEYDMRFVIKKDIFAPCLEMYTFEEWQRRSEEVKSKLNFFNEEHNRFWREFMRNRDVVEPDPKFGRIAISRKLLDAIGVTKEVVFCGNDYKIEIWAKEKFEGSELPDEEYLSIAGKLSEQR